MNAVRTAEALNHQRFELCIVHLQKNGPLYARYQSLGVRMVYLPIPNLYSPRTFLQGWRLAAMLRKWGADVAHAHDIYTNIFTAPWIRLFGNCPVIASRRWWQRTPRPGLSILNRLSYVFANRVLANSTAVGKLLAQEEHVSAKKIVEIPNFLEEHAFTVMDRTSVAQQRTKWGLPADAVIVGIIARLAPVKNHAMLLKAIALLPLNIHLILIGDGPSRPTLEQMAKDLGIAERAHFVGEILSPFNPHQFFDISVLCSLSEGFPNSIIEALAVARPVVATPVGGVIDIIKHGQTGLLVPTDDSAALATTLQTLATDTSLRTQLGAAGQQSVRAQFHKDKVIKKLSALYESMAGKPVQDDQEQC